MSRRTWWALTAIVVVLLGYVGFAVLYSAGLSTQRDFTPATPPAGGLDVDVIPQSFDPVSESVTVIVRVDADPSFYAANGALNRTIALSMSPILDQNVLIFPTGSPDMAVTVRLEVDGTIRTYPFDTHSTRLTASAHVLDADNRPVGEALPLTGGVKVPDGFVQWEVSGTQSNSSTTTTDADIALTFYRSDTTKIAAILMFLLMLTLGIIVLLVMWWVITKRRAVEFGMVTWFAALTFALITVRNNLPGAPPVGVWGDVLVFFWAEFTLLLALTVCMAIWLRAHKDDVVTDDEQKEPEDEELLRGSGAAQV